MVRERVCILEARDETQKTLYIRDGWANIQARRKKEPQTKSGLSQRVFDGRHGGGTLGRMKPPFPPFS